MLKIIFFITSFLLLGWSAKAQEPEITESFLALYQEQLPFFQELITGGEYADSPNTVDGKPYYKSQHFDFGLLSINGIDYQEVPMLYDSYKDHLVTFHPIHKQKILMKPEKVEAFKIFETEEFQFFEGNENYNKHRNGFYKVVSGDEVKVLIKHYKELKPSKDIRQYLYELKEYEDYFLWYQGDFIKVEKMKSAIKSLGLDKKEVRKALGWSQYRFKQDTPGFLKELVAYHSEINSSFTGFTK